MKHLSQREVSLNQTLDKNGNVVRKGNIVHFDNKHYCIENIKYFNSTIFIESDNDIVLAKYCEKVA